MCMVQAPFAIRRADDATFSDAALVSAILAGEAAAQQAACRRFLPAVRWALRRFGPRLLEQEDVVQEVFFTFFRKLHELRDPGALHAFVVAIAVRTGKHHARRGLARWHVEQPVPPEQLGAEVEFLDDLQARHEVGRVYKLLGRARARDRAAFVLRFFEGMTTKETAQALGISIATAQRSTSRARAHLKCQAQRDPFLSTYL